MTPIMELLVFTWLELTFFVVVLPLVIFFTMGYFMRLTLVLRLMRKAYFKHWIINPGPYISSKTFLQKDLKLVEGFYQVEYKRGSTFRRYIVRPEKEYSFYFGGDRIIAHSYNDPNPIKFDGQDSVFVKDKNSLSAMDFGRQMNSKVMSDYVRSKFGRKDIMTMLLIMGLFAMVALNIYLTYSLMQSVNTLIAYMAHLLPSASPVP